MAFELIVNTANAAAGSQGAALQNGEKCEPKKVY